MGSGGQGVGVVDVRGCVVMGVGVAGVRSKGSGDKGGRCQG